MFSPLKAAALTVLAIVVGSVNAERHTIIFDNRCNRGTPMLIQGPNVLSRGGAYTHDGPIRSVIAYLQTGNCGFNGERCTLVETTLVNPNPAQPGSGSSTDISLIPPLAFSVTTGFGYFNGCEPAGANCDNPNCPTAFKVPSDTHVQVACQVNDVNLVITFC
ncbi:hypothetical protein C8J57DRAFT_1429886 [Mycena rebaudengoi]|nr:hypothetical protein C8J57DRAFT_1429886 [Mycena rebaudengoi]